MSHLRILAIALLLVAATGHLIGNLVAGFQHLSNLAWTQHARFHLLQSLMFLAGWDLLVIAISLGPFRHGAGWTAWILVAYVLTVPTAYFIAMATIPAGRHRGPLRHLLYLLQALMFLSGLVIGWPSG